MTPQQRVRMALAEVGFEKTPAEIDVLFRVLYVVLGRSLAKNGLEWDEEKVANAFIYKLKKAEI